MLVLFIRLYTVGLRYKATLCFYVSGWNRGNWRFKTVFLLLGWSWTQTITVISKPMCAACQLTHWQAWHCIFSLALLSPTLIYLLKRQHINQSNTRSKMVGRSVCFYYMCGGIQWITVENCYNINCLLWSSCMSIKLLFKTRVHQMYLK